MYIPKTMTKAIADAFYDKRIEVLIDNTITDAEGGVIYRGTAVVDSFYGNVSFSNCKKIQEEYGLDYEIDIAITTDYELLRHNQLIKYNDVVYNVTDILPTDSHFLIVATKWSQ